MKKTIIIFLILGLALTSCKNGSEQINTGSILTVVKGEENKQYTVEDLQTLPQVESMFNGTNYVGVPLSALLADAGVDAQDLKAVKNTF